MDRQGNRVRFTRLSIALVLLAFLALFGMFAAKRWWEQMTNEETHLAQTEDADAVAQMAPADHETPANAEAQASSDYVHTAPLQSDTENGDPATNAGLLTDANVSSKPTGDSATQVLVPEDSLSPSEQAPPGLHPLDSVLDLARKALVSHRERHFDYTAKLTKTERINKRLLPTTLMDMKLRYREQEPNSSIRGSDLYFKFLEPRAQAGREVIYAPLKYNGKIKAHEGGFLGLITVDLTPNSQLAMRGNRYPLTDAGIEKLIVKLIERGERDRARGDCVVNRTTGHEIAGISCELIEVIHPEKFYTVRGREFEYDFFKAQIWFDMEQLVPVKYSSYQWAETSDSEPLLDEEYIYTDLKFNVGLQDIDFDIENKAYAFP